MRGFHMTASELLSGIASLLDKQLLAQVDVFREVSGGYTCVIYTTSAECPFYEPTRCTAETVEEAIRLAYIEAAEIRTIAFCDCGRAH